MFIIYFKQFGIILVIISSNKFQFINSYNQSYIFNDIFKFVIKYQIISTLVDYVKA